MRGFSFVALLLTSITLLYPASSLADAAASGELLLQGDGTAESDGLTEVSGAPLPRTNGAARGGKSVYELHQKRTYLLAPLIPIDPAKTYHLSAFLRTAESGKSASAYFGLTMYDELERPIGICNVSPIEGTDTHLLKPLQKGDQEAWIASAKTWRHPVQNHRIAFNTAIDYADLPNFQLSPQIRTVTETADGWKVIFREPVAIAYPAQTPIRQHVAWGAGLYWVAKDWVPSEWTSYSTTLTGIQSRGTSKEHFWKGTRYVRVMLRLGNWNRVPEEGARLLVDKISFKETPAPPGVDPSPRK